MSSLSSLEKDVGLDLEISNLSKIRNSTNYEIKIEFNIIKIISLIKNTTWFLYLIILFVVIHQKY